MKFTLVETGGACLLAVSVALHGEKHVEVSSYHGEPQATRMLGEAVSTATVSPIPMFQDWNISLRRIHVKP